MKTQVEKEFEAISAVPRCSFHNEKALAYVIEQAKALDLEYVFDEKNGNVLIRKPASKGKRDRAPILLQGHLDMVPVTKPGVKHDFANEPLNLKVKDGFYYAEGTSLGADDGIAVALSLALLKEKDLKNPPMEVLFTTDEEVGMLSVIDADLDYVRAKYLINLDHCEEGKLLVGSSGGIGGKIFLPAKKEKSSGTRYKISISGLKSGHSGIEIDKERGHSIEIASDLLLALSKITDYKIKTFTIEGKHNAIPNNATIEIIAPGKDEDIIKKTVRDIQRDYRHILRNTDAKVTLKTEEIKRFSGNALTKKCTKNLVALLASLPSGVIHREQEARDKTETSANFGVVEMTDKNIEIEFSIRSSVEKRSALMLERLTCIAASLGGRVKVTDRYPAWLPDYRSPLIAPFKKAYKEQFKKELVIDTVHAGLECGYILEKTGVKSAVSLGVLTIGEHTAEEKLSIESLKQTYAFLKKAVETL